MIALGDSVAAGSGCGCRPFATLLAASISRAHHARVVVTNLARSGLTTSALRSQLDNTEVGRQLRTATVVTITIGANDFDEPEAANPACARAAQGICYRGQASTMAVRLGQVLTRLREETSQDTKMLVTGYWNVFLDGRAGMARGARYRATSDLLTRQVNQLVSEQADKHGATFVDVYQPFEDRGLDQLSVLLSTDGDHPSQSGHQLIARLLFAALSRLTRAAQIPAPATASPV